MANGDKKPVVQRTERGLDIPVPKRGEFFKNLKKVAPPTKGSTTEGSKGKP